MAGNSEKSAPASSAFTDEDVALISEALRIASADIALSVRTLARVWPASPLVERFKVYAERMDALRTSIESAA